MSDILITDKGTFRYVVVSSDGASDTIEKLDVLSHMRDFKHARFKNPTNTCHSLSLPTNTPHLHLCHQKHEPRI